MDNLKEQLLILNSTPLYLFIIGIEIILSHLLHKQLYTFKDTITNAYLMVLNASIDLIFRLCYLVIWQFFFTRAIIHCNIFWIYWVLLFIGEDFLYYWLHRFDHEIRFFWAAHVTHHSSEYYNFTVGFRSSVFQPLYRFVYFIPLAWLGFKPTDILFVFAATQIWGIFVHTKLIKRMGWLEYFLVTPSHHRVHHASNPKYLDKNMGMFLIVWDKLFGTFQPELSEDVYQPIHFGLTKPLGEKNAFSIIFHEWNAILKDISQKDIPLKAKWKYLFGPPGWSHDGTRETSVEMRAKEIKILNEL